VIAGGLLASIREWDMIRTARGRGREVRRLRGQVIVSSADLALGYLVRMPGSPRIVLTMKRSCAALAGSESKSCLSISTSSMALVTFSGYPSSGKTRRAIQLKVHLDRRLADPFRQVVVLSDDSLNIDRSSYNGTVPVPSFPHFQSITTL